MDKDKALVVFQDKKIRRTWFNDEWWFVISDVVRVITDSVNPSDYLKKLRKRDEALSDAFKGGGQIVPPLGIEFDTAGGNQMLQCWNTIGLLRLIQSIPSPKAEPFKQWLAQVGYDRVQEIENPELAQKRIRELYRLKGYSDEWIEKRIRGIAVRDELTKEWKNRGVQENKEFAILTAEISKATFGMTPKEYSEFKGLNKENLRDHMDDMELILSMLGETTTTRLTRERDSKEFPTLKKDAKDGGDVAGATRKDIEQKLGKSVILKDNYLDQPESQKRLEEKKKKEIK